MVREVRLLFGAGAVGAEEVMVESCASVGDAMWWQLAGAGEDGGALGFLSNGVVGIVGSW
jgi:hypothetical protein